MIPEFFLNDSKVAKSPQRTQRKEQGGNSKAHHHHQWAIDRTIIRLKVSRNACKEEGSVFIHKDNHEGITNL